MNQQRNRRTLQDLVLSHDNDFRFNPSRALDHKFNRIPNLSVIIPYYQTGAIIVGVLDCLFRSLKAIAAKYPGWKFEVILLDDGSKRLSAAEFTANLHLPELQLFKRANNVGRSRTRNEGLLRIQYDVCLFMDSDILVGNCTVLNMLKLWQRNRDLNSRNAIVFSLFENRADCSTAVWKAFIRARVVHVNDFRVRCIYKPEWIGCKGDLQFAFKKFALLKETTFMRNWDGWHGPWCLPNMVLGGLFLVDREEALLVNGFDEMFKGYGFTETSLVTKLIAAQGHFVIPQPRGGALHCAADLRGCERESKDRQFRAKHKLYFGHYVNLAADEAIRRKLHGW